MEDKRPIQISARQLSKRFPSQTRSGNDISAYDDLNFNVYSGEFLCILGPSGCGKSTVLRTIAALEQPTAGVLHIAPAADGSAADVGMAFQERGIFPWMTVAQNIHFLLANNPRIPKHDRDAIVAHSIAKVGLTKFADHYPHQISGGMKQRVSIARSFANDPDILLMDEPFVFLDYQTRISLQELLLDIWQESQKTVVFVTHDIEEAVILADRIIVMTAHPGRIKSIIEVDFPRPRHVNDIRHTAQYIEHVDRISGMISDEINDFMAMDIPGGGEA
jgi:NitT/TauT family transport system ATP-binding protein